ncbi:hypothetical protein LJR231_004187 [Phyllobacterium sp. LjRoot231]|uniref:hypothetical protein n=1 Tax=Phyllobacterium sp. LjRoot231 TaxID=3342289 RepID=UPI003ECF3BD3
MIILNPSAMPARPEPRVLPGRLAHLLQGHRGLIVLGALALGLGAASNWSWLVAAGVVPLLLSALPCVAMCALGLCMSRMNSSSKGKASPIASSEGAEADGSMKVGSSCCSPAADIPPR